MGRVTVDCVCQTRDCFAGMCVLCTEGGTFFSHVQLEKDKEIRSLGAL